MHKLLINKLLEKDQQVFVRSAFGETVKKIRLKKGLKQKEVAKRCGFYTSGYNSIESGQRNVSLSTIYKIALALEVPISRFFDDKEFHEFLKKVKGTN